MSCTCVLVSVGAITMLSSAQVGGPVYVDDDAPLGGDGTSWGTAYRLLQDALADAAASGGAEVRIAQGLYTPDQDESGNVTPGDRAATFHLVNGVSLLGGFAGLGAPDPDRRDVDLYITTLSGDLLGDDNPDDFPAGNSYGENSFHVLTVEGADESAVLGGVTVSAGNADGSGFAGMGGGILTSAFASPRIVDCLFEHNFAAQEGGAIANFVASPMILDCTFTRNAANTEPGLGEGGAIANAFGSPSILACTFSLNSAGFGGAMHNDAGAPVLDGCSFIENEADFGGALYNKNTSQPLMIDCLFDQNTALTGGAMYSTFSFPMCISSDFTNNIATNGGALTNAAGSATVIDSYFAGNFASSTGGAMSLKFGASVVIGCLLSSNEAHNSGGAIENTVSDSLIVASQLINNTADSGGAVHNFNQSSPVFVNCLLYGNTAEFAGAFSGGGATPFVINCTISGNVATTAGGLGIVGPTTVTNCIVVSNEPDQIVGGDFVTYSCVEGGWPGEGNIDADPLFVNPDDGDFRLSPGSPCIDAGDNTAVPEDIETDLDGNPRFLEIPETPDTGNGMLPIVDMGAYESLGGGCFAVTNQEVVCHADGTTFTVNVEGLNACTGGTTQVTFTASGGATGQELCFAALVNDGGFCCSTEICVTIPDCTPLPKPSDLDGDGIVDIVDFLALLAAWGSCSDCGTPAAWPADFDGDCSVGILDLLILMGNWG